MEDTGSVAALAVRRLLSEPVILYPGILKAAGGIKEKMECYHDSCPYFNFDKGPFEYTEEDLKKISDEFDCSLIMARICASTTPDGVVHDEEALNIVYNGEKEEEENA